MKHARIIALAIGIGAGVAGAALADMPITQPVLLALTPIDSSPSTQQLNLVHDNDPVEALTNLESIARAPGTSGAGVQIRAIRALVHYCDAPCATHEAHTTVVDLLTQDLAHGGYADAKSGSELLVLRATIETIGLLHVPSDLDVLRTHLSDSSRDIRVATAFALRDLGNPDAITYLRERYQIELNEQVKSAISDALRVLGQPI